MSCTASSCLCATATMVGPVAGALTQSRFQELDESLSQIGARRDAQIAFVLRWKTPTDIDSWMLEPPLPGGKVPMIGWTNSTFNPSTPHNYRGQLAGTNNYNYVLDAMNVNVNYTQAQADGTLSPSGGNLDIDNTGQLRNGYCTENMVYFDTNMMATGDYQYRLDDYSGTHSSGFELFILRRNHRLELEGFAELRWEGPFTPNVGKRKKDMSLKMVTMTKHPDGSIIFRKEHEHLTLHSNDGLQWV